MEEMEKPEMKKGRKGQQTHLNTQTLQYQPNDPQNTRIYLMVLRENNYEHHHREIKCGEHRDRRKAHRQCHHKEVLLALCFRVKRERREEMW